MNLPVLLLTAASCFTAGMLVEAVVWGRRTARKYRQLRRAFINMAAERDRWQRAAMLRTRHPALRARNGLRAVDN